MPDSALVSVGKAVVARIEEVVALGDFAKEFTLRRNYADWDLELKEMDPVEDRERDKLLVDVVTHTTEQEVEQFTRGKISYQIPVDIAVRFKFGPDNRDKDTGRVLVSAVDDLTLLVQQIHLAFMAQRLTGFTYAVWDDDKGGTQILANPDRKHLKNHFQFTGIVRVTFKVPVDLA